MTLLKVADGTPAARQAVCHEVICSTAGCCLVRRKEDSSCAGMLINLSRDVSTSASAADAHLLQNHQQQVLTGCRT